MQPILPSGTKVLVTGATGFTGSWLVKKLLKQGVQVSAIARSSERCEELKNLGVQVFEGQVFDPEIVAKAVPGNEYIFHVAAAFREAKIQDDVYRKVHVDSTKHLVNAALKESNFKRFVHISTMGVHGHIENPPGSEQSPYSPGDEYQRTKLAAELWLQEYAKENNFPYTIVRPTGIYGPGDKRLLKVFKMALWPIFPVLGKGKCLYHLTHVEDLTNSFILAAIHPAAQSDVFLCGADEAIPLVEMARIVADELNAKHRVLRIPVTPFFILGDLCELVCKPFGIEPPIYRRRVAFYTKDRCFDTSKIRNVLGHKNVYTNEEGIRMTAKWYREQGWL